MSSAALAIYRKEWRGFWTSPSFLIVCAITAVVLSFKYFEALAVFVQSLERSFMPMANNKAMNIHYGVFLGHLSVLNLIMIFAVPAFTMKLIAEEKKLRTYDLLLTVPVSSAQIVLGKFFAALTAVVFMVGLALAYPLATRPFAEFHWPMLMMATLGITLVAIMYSAVDLFCSSLTESAIVAYVLSVIFNITLWLIGSVSQVVESSVVRSIFDHISLTQHLSAMVEGTLRTSSLVFFISVTAAFVFLTERVVEASRWR